MSSNKNFDLSSILQCPFCRSSLRRINDLFFCKCGARFPIINGVVNLLVDITDQKQLDSWEARKLDERKIAPWLSKWVTSVQMNLKSIKNKLNGSLVLDLGSGPLFPTGPIKLLFKPKRVVAVDFCYHEIKTHGDFILKTLGVSDEGISRIVFDLNANRLPFASSIFDVVLGVFILHHIYDPGSILTEVRRVLKPNGICWFMESCKPYVPLIKKYFMVEASVVKEEEKWGPTRSWKHYFEWEKLFFRNFSIKYFGWTPDSYRRVEKARIIRRTPHTIKKLAIMVQFYIRVLFAWKPFEAIIVVIAKKNS